MAIGARSERWAAWSQVGELRLREEGLGVHGNHGVGRSARDPAPLAEVLAHLAKRIGGRTAGLLGRDVECAELDRLLAAVARGDSQVRVLRGPAGVGKTALLDYAVERAEGWHVLRATGVESEMELPYSVLHQLCAPALDQLDRLPAPQQAALRTVFGISGGPVPDRFLVGLATLSLLAESAEDVPMLCIVDDAQWLDEASAQLLAFVARRLFAERIALVGAARSGIGDSALEGLPELSVLGIDDDSARRLLASNLQGRLDDAVRDQIIADCHGNPLALLELPRTWRSLELAGGFGLPDSHAVLGRIERSFTERLASLPSDTQLLVLTAAAEPLGDPALLRRAADSLGFDLTVAAPAVDEELLQLSARVEFAHPLVRSAAYQAATAVERRRVHQALATATDPESDPDRRAWHRARAASGPDEEVAADLERSAGRAQARAGAIASAAFLTRSAELTPVPAVRVRRALDAAFASVEAAAFGKARHLVQIASDGPLDALQRARVELLRARLAFASTRGNEAASMLLAAAKGFESMDIDVARDTYLEAFTVVLFGERLNDSVRLADVAEAIRHAPPHSGDAPRVPDLLLDAFAALSGDYETAIPKCRTALATLSDSEDDRRWLWHRCVMALEMWDDQSAWTASHAGVESARARGAVSELALMLSAHTSVLLFCGEVVSASMLVAETASIAEATGMGSAPYGALHLGAMRGEAQRVADLAEATIRDAGRRGEGVGIAVAEWARSLLLNATGQYEQALVAAQSASGFGESVVQNWGLVELIEAATRLRRTDVAREAFEKLAKKTRASGSNWGRGVEARSRALLSGGDAAERAYAEAIACLQQTRVRTELARSHLAYGEWLRRENRRIDSREQLQKAHEMFNEMTAAGFLERTRRELVATGAKVRKRTPETRDQLTAQEAQIARLAAGGLSNPEIGAQLFISPRTVEWHLRKVFGKLGISSRSELRRNF